MGRPGFRELVGRAMIDKEFFAELVRDPAAVLAGYDLEAEERAAVMTAAARTGRTSEAERARALRIVMMKRWAT